MNVFADLEIKSLKRLLRRDSIDSLKTHARILKVTRCAQQLMKQRARMIHEVNDLYKIEREQENEYLKRDPCYRAIKKWREGKMYVDSYWVTLPKCLHRHLWSTACCNENYANCTTTRLKVETYTSSQEKIGSLGVVRINLVTGDILCSLCEEYDNVPEPLWREDLRDEILKLACKCDGRDTSCEKCQGVDPAENCATCYGTGESCICTCAVEGGVICTCVGARNA